MRFPNPRIAYSDLRVRSADSLELVIMLYDMLSADLHSALDAIHNCDIELRSNELNHALRVVEQLQGTLNLENGGEAAAQLDRFYDFMRGRILQAQLRSSSAQIAELIAAVVLVCGAWKHIQEEQSATARIESAAAALTQREQVHANWTA